MVAEIEIERVGMILPRVAFRGDERNPDSQCEEQDEPAEERAFHGDDILL
jgi:hypothetical protein